ncbi:MAG TPA: response regulator transcription factor [Bacteroidota bacterium]|nr:response regulator transcription factor [Bacteroidota bacterium]
MIRVFIADDHALIREGLRTLLLDEQDIKIIGEANSGLDVVAEIERLRPDIAILDITLPGRSGLDLLKDIARFEPRIPVLFLTMHPERRYALRAFRSGAAGYLTKESAPDELVRAIRKIIGGGRYVTPKFSEHLTFDLQAPAERPPHETLSDREFQVLLGIATGRPTKDVAAELSVSEATVYTYRERLLKKMGLKSSTEFTRYCLEHGLIE